ncbi:hypothetical protein Rsub_12850 [Raphidocelis subcapitata]|uniref:Major facilitator superfamily associated domain-containing protein n=1 Tax=Raphidocelis subcapitata TaxID=307507 RepID=A0A2V0PJY3_9CHLO|nr:hypothetical protein Rsub_12850 [Raphidocelis subcapitata]|eukprot:GBG00109.1 hypothetical protein Rsub_12850 [Raphidocelis subcapitata]
MGEGGAAAAAAAGAVAKAWYFFFFAAGVCLQPYINVVVFRAGGMSEQQIGVLSALRPWVSAPAAFLWSALADARRAHRAIFLAALALGAAARLGLAAASGFWAFAALSAASEALGAPVTLLADAAVVASSRGDGDYGQTRLYGAWGWGVFGAVSGWAVGRFGGAAAFGGYAALLLPCAWLAARMEMDPLVGKRAAQAAAAADAAADAAAAAAVSSSAAAVGGGGGGGEASAIAVEMAPRKGPRAAGAAGDAAGQRPDQGCPPWAGGGGGDAERDAGPEADGGVEAEGAPLLASAASHAAGAEAASAPAAPPQPSFRGKLRLLLSCPAVLVFFGQATIMGFGIGVIGDFLFLYLQDLGGSRLLMGLTLTVTCASEIPAFMAQGWLLQRVSTEALLHFVIATYAARLALYWALPFAGGAWAVLPIELLHGITFGCGWGGGTVHCKRLAERLGLEGLEATLQGCFQGLYFGVGQGLGALLGGVLTQRRGRAMWAHCAALTLAAWAACAAAECVFVRRGGVGGRAAGSGGRAGGGQTNALRPELKSKASGPDLSGLRPPDAARPSRLGARAAPDEAV